MCHYVVQELEPGETCRIACRLPQHCERLFVLAFSSAKCHSIVCGSCTCGLNKFDTISQKYEAVKENLEVQKRKALALGLWQSHLQAQAQPQPRPQRVSCDSASQLGGSMEKLAVWKGILALIGRENSRASGKNHMTWGSVWIFDFQHCQGSVLNSMI